MIVFEIVLCIIFCVIAFLLGWMRGFTELNTIENWGIGFDDGWKAHKEFIAEQEEAPEE